MQEPLAHAAGELLLLVCTLAHMHDMWLSEVRGRAGVMVKLMPSLLRFVDSFGRKMCCAIVFVTTAQFS
jgi:hypothetical protein